MKILGEMFIKRHLNSSVPDGSFKDLHTSTAAKGHVVHHQLHCLHELTVIAHDL